MTRNHAAEEFTKAVLEHGYFGGIKVVEDLLNQPPTTREGNWEKASQWFQELTPEKRELVRALIKQTVAVSLESLLVFLDGAAGYHYAAEKPVVFRLRADLFSSVETAEHHEIEAIIEICPTTQGEDLHDIFFHLVEEAEALPK